MKYVPSALIGQLSRSQGSTTASRNRFGSYFRNRTMPANPDTAKQTTFRQRLQDLSAMWRTLTDLQRTGWNQLGLEIVRQDSLGQSYTLTGLQVFTSLGLNLLLVGDAVNTDAPALETPPESFTLTLEVDVTSDPIEINVTSNVAVPTGGWLVLEATAPVSQGISFMPRSAYKVVQIFTSAAWASPQNIMTAYVAIFGAPNADERVFLSARVITPNGFGGTRVKTSDVAA